jgi:hypothetical protein
MLIAAVSALALAAASGVPATSKGVAALGAEAFVDGCLNAGALDGWAERAGWTRLEATPTYLALMIPQGQPIWRQATANGYVLAYSVPSLQMCSIAIYGDAAGFIDQIRLGGASAGLEVQSSSDPHVLMMRGVGREDGRLRSVIGAVVNHGAAVDADDADPATAYVSLTEVLTSEGRTP